MLPLVTYGMTDASTTRSPDTPCTAIDSGSVTDSGPVPIAHVQDGCSAVSASLATHSSTSASLDTDGPGESSPALNSSNAGWFRMRRAIAIASVHSARSVGVDRELNRRAGFSH